MRAISIPRVKLYEKRREGAKIRCPSDKKEGPLRTPVAWHLTRPGAAALGNAYVLGEQG